jgi:hypothetical protein
MTKFSINSIKPKLSSQLHQQFLTFTGNHTPKPGANMVLITSLDPQSIQELDKSLDHLENQGLSKAFKAHLEKEKEKEQKGLNEAFRAHLQKSPQTGKTTTSKHPTFAGRLNHDVFTRTAHRKV